MDSRRSAKMPKTSIKVLTLAILTLQNSALILIMHYSRVMPLVGGHRYFTSTAVFLNEVIKLAMSLTMALYDLSRNMPAHAPATTLFSDLARAVFTGDSWKLALPAMLYTLQNSLQYIAVSNLDAATFQVVYQLKILTTAVFSVTLLRRTLNLQQWLSLIMLMLGVAIVQIPSGSEPPILTLKDLKEGSTGWRLPRTVEQMRDMGSVAAGQLLTRRSATYEGIEEDYSVSHPRMNASIGLLSVLGTCLLSGLAGVYFEKMLKDSTTKASLWVRNVQLSMYSLFPALFIGVMFRDGEDISKHGFFAGYNWVVWSAIICQALGGVIVALVINYTDNIAKNFATSISIVVSFLVSIFYFDFPITISYLAGTAIVIGATYLYSSQEQKSTPPPVNVSNYEKDQGSSGGSYFDIEGVSTPMAKSPMLGNALTTSRPGTPSFERRHFRTRTEEIRFSKRDE